MVSVRMLGYVVAMALLAVSGLGAQATGISDGTIKIGVISDMSGALSDLSGKGSVVAAQLAIDDFGGAIDGAKIELISADHQNKPDVGSAILRKWFDTQGVDAIADISNSGVGFAAVELANKSNKIVLSTVGSSDFSGKACSPISFQWTYSTYTNSVGLAKALLSRGLDTWYLVTVDYAFGHQMAADLRRVVASNGGKVVGETRHPLNSSDFASPLLQAQASGSKVVVLANAGGDTTNSVKQAAEFGLLKKQVLAIPAVWITDIDAMGLEIAQGLEFIETFYWDRDEKTRAWAKRYFDKMGKMPTSQHAGTYSAVRHYLKAIKAIGTDEAQAVAVKMKELPVEDDAFGKGTVRPNGSMMHDFILAKVKKPSESKGRWDYYDVLSVVKAEDVYPKLEDTGCKLVK